MTDRRAVNLGTVSRTLDYLLSRSARNLMMFDRGGSTMLPLSRDLAVAADGVLPVFLVAADTIWRDATGNSFGVRLARDPSALLGFRAEGIDGGPFSAVMLSMMEAIEQTISPSMLLLNDFDKLWRSVEVGFGVGVKPLRRPGVGPGP
jgi:hypothetical protein